MRVLFGCEESQVGTKEFLRLGHEAYSCDLVDTRGEYPDRHLQMDVKDAITHCGPWDRIILHPDCTRLSLSGNRWYGKNMPRHDERLWAIDWTLDLYDRAVKAVEPQDGGVCLENPKSVIFPLLKKKGAIIQYFQPYHFGHKEYKETGIALHNLPELEYNENWEAVKRFTDAAPKQETERVWRMAPGPNRKRDRSESYVGIMKAMAEQWGQD